MACESSCIVFANFFDCNQSRIVRPILIMPFDVNPFKPQTDLEPFDASKQTDVEDISKHTAETTTDNILAWKQRECRSQIRMKTCSNK